MALRTVPLPPTTEVDPYVGLAFGILRQAVRDAGLGNQEAIHFLTECDEFLVLLDVDPACFRRNMAVLRG